MTRKSFLKKADRLLAEVENEKIVDGHELNLFETASTVYERLFNESVPTFENGLPDETKAKAILECVFGQRKISELTAVEFLQLQYECRFDEQLTYDFMTINTEERLVTTLRDCLKTGKPYELPKAIKRQIAQDAVF